MWPWWSFTSPVSKGRESESGCILTGFFFVGGEKGRKGERGKEVGGSEREHSEQGGKGGVKGGVGVVKRKWKMCPEDRGHPG